jgi:hypothetical protein
VVGFRIDEMKGLYMKAGERKGELIRLNYMKTKTFSKIVLLFSLISIIFASCATYQEPSPAATLPPLETETPAVPTREVVTREVPDKFDQLTPIVPIDKEPIDMTPISPAELPANLQDVADQAMTELADKLSIQKGQISLISVQSVVWSDSSLGCPQPDMNYLMVLTEGYRVVLTADDEPYYYHANKRGYGIFCESPNPPYSEGAVDR